MKKKILLIASIIYLFASIGCATSIMFYYRLVPVGHYFFKNTVPGTVYGNATNLNFNSLELSEYSNEGAINLVIAFSIVFFVLSNICFYKYYKSTKEQM
jgi:hypothetical protein